jgi:hypothetical protein
MAFLVALGHANGFIKFAFAQCAPNDWSKLARLCAPPEKRANGPSSRQATTPTFPADNGDRTRRPLHVRPHFHQVHPRGSIGGLKQQEHSHWRF